MESFGKECPGFRFKITKKDFPTGQADHKLTIRKEGESVDLNIFELGGWGRDIDYRVLRGGSIKEPLFLDGEERTTVPLEKEFVMRGGCLLKPVLLTDLHIIAEKRFFKVQKWIPAFCLFLTGKTEALSVETCMYFRNDACPC